MAGFSIRADRLPLQRYDDLAAAAGLVAAGRWATWGAHAVRRWGLRGIGAPDGPVKLIAGGMLIGTK